jgi:hypothetical protein
MPSPDHVNPHASKETTKNITSNVRKLKSTTLSTEHLHAHATTLLLEWAAIQKPWFVLLYLGL